MHVFEHQYFIQISINSDILINSMIMNQIYSQKNDNSNENNGIKIGNHDIKQNERHETRDETTKYTKYNVRCMYNVLY